MLAQYAYATTDAFSAEEGYGKAVATVMFVLSNTALLVVHARLVAVPLWHLLARKLQSTQQLATKLQESFAAGASKRLILELRVCLFCGELTMWTNADIFV